MHMTDAFKTRTDAIEEALRALSPDLSRTGPARWRVLLSNGSLLPVTAWPVTAWIDREWLQLDAPLERIVAEKSLWNLLLWNSQLDGLAKFAVGRQTRTVHLRAEMPCNAEGNFVGLLRETGVGFHTASALMQGEKVATARAAARSSLPVAPSDDRSTKPGRDKPCPYTCDLAELCRAAGWPSTERAGGEAIVELDAPGSGSQATVETRGSGILVRTDLTRGADYSELSSEALSLLLLTTSGIVRMTRAAASCDIEEPDAATVRFEVGFASAPSPEELSTAFSAIGVASRLARREAEVLKHEAVARHYLSSYSGAGLAGSLALEDTTSNGGGRNGNGSHSKAESRTRSERRLRTKATQGEQHRSGRDDWRADPESARQDGSSPE